MFNLNEKKIPSNYFISKKMSSFVFYFQRMNMVANLLPNIHNFFIHTRIRLCSALPYHFIEEADI